jgi:16S rRNA (cytidine1402-2'-O)-methyltransferase
MKCTGEGEKMEKESGKLYICATPIGNLEDITLRVLRILKEVDLIVAEDTRRTLQLLNYYDIRKPLESCHRHNEKNKIESFLRELKSGKKIALVSDAGTPIISDPGDKFIKLCIENNIEITSLPGASALINGLVLSGLPPYRFSFEGFLPVNKKKRLSHLESIKKDTRTLIFYEAPHKIAETLKDMLNELGDREVALCRELTKKYEEVLRCKISKALDIYEETQPKGEFVIVLEGANENEVNNEAVKDWLLIPIEDHINYLLINGYDKKEALKKVAEQRGINKREVYKTLINKNGR